MDPRGDRSGPEAAGQPIEGGHPLRTPRAAVVFGEMGVGPDTPTSELPAPYGAVDGETQIGRYIVRGAIGRGGYGYVVRAYDPILERDVAVKVLHRGSEADKERVERFFREARAAARLDHPNIVPIHEVGWHEGRPFIVMELAGDEDLVKVATRGAIPGRRAAEMVRDVALAVETAHRAGIVHRDIKPSNILLAADGRARLTDFGIARDSRSPALTAPNHLLGPPHYLAPEQLEPSSDRGGHAADIYALGAVLYRLVVGRPPFDGTSAVNVIRAVMFDAPTPPSLLRTEVPEGLEAIALRCLEKSPEDRYATAEELAADLDRFLAAMPTLARRRGRLSRALARVRRHPRTTIACLLGVVSAAVAVAIVLGLRSGPDVPAAPPAERPQLTFTGAVIPGDGAVPRPLAAGAVEKVREGDGIRFQLELDRPRFVYLFNVDASGRAYCLFPSAYEAFYRPLMAAKKLERAPLRNPVPAGRAAIPTPLPELGVGPDAWFRFDDVAGTERYYLFASADPVPELEDLVRRVEGGSDAARAEARASLLLRAEVIRGSYEIETGTAPAEIRLDESPKRRLDALAVRLRGEVIVHEWTLDHEPSKGP